MDPRISTERPCSTRFWGAEEAPVHRAGRQGTVRRAVEAAEFALPAADAGATAEAFASTPERGLAVVDIEWHSLKSSVPL